MLFRTNAVATILPDRAQLDDCVAALREIGVAADEINVLHGEEGARVLDVEGEHHGSWARFVRGLQRLETASNERENYANALKRGRVVVIVPAQDNAEADACGQVLVRHRRPTHPPLRRPLGEQLSF